MKMLSAALAAFTFVLSLTLGAVTAQAKDSSRAWNASAGEAQALLDKGARLCYGDAQKKRQSICSVYDPSSRIRVTSVNVRPDGVNKNLHYIMVSPTDERGQPLRDELGRPIVIAGHIAEQANGSAIWMTGLSNVPAAALNGSVAAGINALANPCGGQGGCGNFIIGNGVTALAGSQSGSASTANVQGLASCATTGVCRQ